MIAALAHAQPVYEFADAAADLVLVTPSDESSAREILGQIYAAGGHPKAIADLVVTFGRDSEFRSDAQVFAGSAAQLADLLLGWHDLGLAGFRLRPAVNATDLPVIVDEVVPLLQRAGRFPRRRRDRPARAADACDGFILVPHLTPHGLDEFIETVVPRLQERGAFRTEYSGATLRENLGLGSPDSATQRGVA